LELRPCQRGVAHFGERRRARAPAGGLQDRRVPFIYSSRSLPIGSQASTTRTQNRLPIYLSKLFFYVIYIKQEVDWRRKSVRHEYKQTGQHEYKHWGTRVTFVDPIFFLGRMYHEGCKGRV
jgi:hypothetical protein